MTNIDQQLMFHLTNGALRRFSLWNEKVFPEWAHPSEQEKWTLFQNWKQFPSRSLGPDANGNPIIDYHPMGEFENWSYRLILEVLRGIQFPEDMYILFAEPDSLKEAIVQRCEYLYSNFEQQGADQLTPS